LNKSYPDNLKGAIILLFASLIWGSTFVPQKIAMDFWSPLQFTAIRFLIGAFLLLLIIPFFQLPKRLNLKPLIMYGLALGAFLGFAALFQQIGLVTTTATNAGFFTSLYVLLVPIIGIFLGSLPHFSLWIAVVICIFGSMLLAVPEGNFILEKINKGDIWVIIGSLLWAFHVQVLSFGVKKNPIMLLAILQFFSASLVLFVFGFLFSPNDLLNFPNLFINPLVLGTLTYCSVGSVCIAFVLQMIGQRYSPPNEAAIIMSTEAIFAAFFGWLILSEFFNARIITGSLLIFIGIVISQIYPMRNYKIFNVESEK
tara:strand:- start:322 stop:1257 length:936 start_codon:yes stop_codon:yes gene_type:complete